MNRQSLINLAAVLLLVPAAAFCAELHVAPGGPGPSPFNSWATAAPDIQSAVNAATANDTILISNGTYTLTSKVSLNKSLTLQGVPTDAAPTIDGNDAVKCLESSAAAYIRLKNLRIVNGRGTYGAGVRLYDGEIHDCFFSNNVSGSGLYITGSGLVERTTFVTNTADWSGPLATGGAILARESPYLRIHDCLFRNNVAVSSGGAVYLRAVGGLLMSACRFVDNTTTGGNGGAIATGDPPVNDIPNRIERCWFAGNRAGLNDGGASKEGGGIAVSGVGYTVTDCIISNNVAVNLGGGASISSGATLQDSLIIHNRQEPALAHANRGAGGVSISGGGRVINCRIEGNSSVYQGGGVFMNPTDSLLRNCLILNNRSTGISYGGGGVRFRFDDAGSVENCTIVSNYATVGGGGVGATYNGIRFVNCIIYSNICGSASYNNYRVDTDKVVAFTNCCFTPALGSAIGAYSADNLTDNPRFADADYRLTGKSPCINAGLILPWMETTRDLDGRMRLDTQGRLPDIGCYEFLPPGSVLLVR